MSATHQSYVWSAESQHLAEQTNIVAHAAQIASRRPALLMLQGTDDTVASVGDAEALRIAVGRRVEVVEIFGLAHSWTKSPALGAIRTRVAEWFNQHG